jgi:hypothetical protein
MRETATSPSGFHLPWAGRFEKGKLPPAGKTAAKSLEEGLSWAGRYQLALAFEVVRELLKWNGEAKQTEMTPHGVRLHWESSPK